MPGLFEFLDPVSTWPLRGESHESRVRPTSISLTIIFENTPFKELKPPPQINSTLYLHLQYHATPQRQTPPNSILKCPQFQTTSSTRTSVLYHQCIPHILALSSKYLFSCLLQSCWHSVLDLFFHSSLITRFSTSELEENKTLSESSALQFPSQQP